MVSMLMETHWLVLTTMNVLTRRTVGRTRFVPMLLLAITVLVLGVSMIQLMKTHKMNWTDKLIQRWMRLTDQQLLTHQLIPLVMEVFSSVVLPLVKMSTNVKLMEAITVMLTLVNLVITKYQGTIALALLVWNLMTLQDRVQQTIAVRTLLKLASVLVSTELESR